MRPEYFTCRIFEFFQRIKHIFFNNYTLLPASYFLYPLSYMSFIKLRTIGLIIRRKLFYIILYPVPQCIVLNVKIT